MLTPPFLSLRRTAASLVGLVCLLATVPGLAFSPVEPLPEGWQGKIKLGAHAITGPSDNRQLLVASELDYRNDRFEARFNIELLRVSSTFMLKESNESAEAAGRSTPRYEMVETETADRRYLGMHPQWFWLKNTYVMLILDYEENEPEGLELKSRRVAGFGHRLWNSKDDLLAAEIGSGSVVTRGIGSEGTEEEIAYLGVKYSRDVSDRTRFTVELDADFGGEEDFTQLKVSTRFKLADGVALRIKFSAHTQRGSGNSSRVKPRVSQRDSETAVFLEFDLF